MTENHNRDDPSAGEEISPDKLDHDRQLSRLRLKSTFEDIFTKYECDFSNVGDEIDLETEEVIVDNGHLSGMLDEQDVGRAVADQYLRCFEPEPLGDGGEVEEEEMEGEEGEEEEEEEKRERERVNSSGLGPVQQDAFDYRYQSDQPKQVLATSSRHTNVERRAVPYNTMRKSYTSQTSVTGQVAGQMHGNVNHNPVSHFESAALQALSTSIACQITQFLSSMRQSMAPQRQSVWENVPPLPRKEINASKPVQRKISEINCSSSKPLQSKSLWAVPTMRQKRKHYSSDLPHSSETPISHGQLERRSSNRAVTSEDEKAPKAFLSKSSPISVMHAARKGDKEGLKENHASYSANTKRRIIHSQKEYKSRHSLSKDDRELIFDLRWNRKESWDYIMSYFPAYDRESLQRRYYKLKKRKVPSSEPQQDGEESKKTDEVSIKDVSPLSTQSKRSSLQIMQAPKLLRSPDPSTSLSVEIYNTRTSIPNSTSDINDSLLNSSSKSKGSVDDVHKMDDKEVCNSQETPALHSSTSSTPRQLVEQQSRPNSKDYRTPATKNSKDYQTPATKKRTSILQNSDIDDELTLGSCHLPQVLSSKRRRTKKIQDIWKSEDELAVLETNW